MLKLYETCASGKLLALMEYHMGAFLRWANHISRTAVKMELKITRNSVVDRVFFIWYRVWPLLAAITTLNRRGMLRTRTSILSGVTAPQAFDRASRNLNTVVGRLSISLINIPIWSKYVQWNPRAWQNRWWAVKFCKGWGRSFKNSRGHSNESNIDFHRLRGKTDALVVRFHTIGDQFISE